MRYNDGNEKVMEKKEVNSFIKLFKNLNIYIEKKKISDEFFFSLIFFISFKIRVEWKRIKEIKNYNF